MSEYTPLGKYILLKKLPKNKPDSKIGKIITVYEPPEKFFAEVMDIGNDLDDSVIDIGDIVRYHPSYAFVVDFDYPDYILIEEEHILCKVIM